MLNSDIKGIKDGIKEYTKEDKIYQLYQKLSGIEDRREEIARLSDEEIDKKEIIEEIKDLKKKEKEILEKIEEFDKKDSKKTSIFVSRG